MSQSVRLFMPAFAVGALVLLGLFSWLGETTSSIFWLLSIIGGAAIGLLALLTARRYPDDTVYRTHIDLATRLAFGLGLFALAGLNQFFDGSIGFVVMLAAFGLLAVLFADFRYHMLPAAERPPTSGWLGAPLLIRKFNPAWGVRVLAVVCAVEIAIAAFTQSYTVDPCSPLDLARRLDGCIGVIEYAEMFNQSAYAPNGRFAATADSEGTIHVWSLPEIKRAYTLSSHTPEVARPSPGPDIDLLSLATRLRFSPDSAILASASWDRTIRLWNVADGTPLRTIQGLTDSVDVMTFSPDGTIIASNGRDRLIRLWRVADGTLLRTIESPELMHSIAFNHDGSLLLSAGISHTMHLWRVQDGTLARTIDHTATVQSVIFSPDGQLLAAGDDAHTINLWRVSDGSLVRTMKGQRGYSWALAFSPDSSLLVSGAALDYADVGIWRVSDGTLVRTLDASASAQSLDFSSDGSRLAIGSFDSVYFWRIR